MDPILLSGEWTAYAPGDLIPGEPVAVAVRIEENEVGQPVVTGVLLTGAAISSDVLRKVPIRRLEAGAYDPASPDPAALPPLRREPGMSPEDFSKLVADHYRAWAKAVPNPGAAMAKAAKVNPATVHTWIREARLRGFLPPASRKKGGGAS